jgi:hypothetical protein
VCWLLPYETLQSETHHFWQMHCQQSSLIFFTKVIPVQKFFHAITNSTGTLMFEKQNKKHIGIISGRTAPRALKAVGLKPKLIKKEM